MELRTKILAVIERKTEGEGDPNKISLYSALKMINEHEEKRGLHSSMEYNTLRNYYEARTYNRSTELRIAEGLGLC